MGSLVSSSAARMRGTSPPWWMSEPFSIIHRAMASRVSLGGTRGTRHSATHVSGPALAVAERSAVELRVARHEALDLLQVVGVNGQLELPGELQRFDVRLELGPTREAVLPGDLELRLRERPGLAGLKEVFGLVLEMAEVGVFGKLARVLRSGWTWQPSFRGRPVSARRAERRFVRLCGKQVGFYPFRGPGASCTRRWIVQGWGGRASSGGSAQRASLRQRARRDLRTSFCRDALRRDSSSRCVRMCSGWLTANRSRSNASRSVSPALCRSSTCRRWAHGSSRCRFAPARIVNTTAARGPSASLPRNSQFF